MIRKTDINYQRVEKGVYQGSSPDGHKMLIYMIGKKECLGALHSPEDELVGKISAPSCRAAKDSLYELMVDYPNMVRI